MEDNHPKPWAPAAARIWGGSVGRKVRGGTNQRQGTPWSLALVADAATSKASMEPHQQRPSIMGLFRGKLRRTGKAAFLNVRSHATRWARKEPVKPCKHERRERQDKQLDGGRSFHARLGDGFLFNTRASMVGGWAPSLLPHLACCDGPASTTGRWNRQPTAAWPHHPAGSRLRSFPLSLGPSAAPPSPIDTHNLRKKI